MASLIARITCFASLASMIAAAPARDPLQTSIRVEIESEKYNLEPVGTFAFAGIATFHQLPSTDCLANEDLADDILVVGFPFDTATSYRTGTRFGPNAIRRGSSAASLSGHYSYRQSINPFEQGVSIVDCGDFPISPFDNGLAFAQMEEWYKRLLNKKVKNPTFGAASAKTGKTHPKIIALGGDHSISLPILRALSTIYGPVSAIHIDAHIDTWTPEAFAGAHVVGSKQARFADGTPYYWAGLEGLLTDTCVHAGIRSTLDSAKDMKVDAETGFTTIPASDILKERGVHGVIDQIRAIVPHDTPVYVSLDIDSLDPAFAPGTAGPSAGGWTTREVMQIVIEALAGLNIVGVDVVEVLPGLDTAEITAIAAAELTFELITTMIKNGMH